LDLSRGFVCRLVVVVVGQTKESKEGLSKQEIIQYRDCVKSGLGTQQAFASKLLGRQKRVDNSLTIVNVLAYKS
jgi:hypothetical protein